MEGDAGFAAALISVRIVSIDHYLQPLSGHSSALPFQAAALLHPAAAAAPKLPVVRIFGATPAGQPCCLHVHGLRPYLYLPLPRQVRPQHAYAYAASLRDAIDKCLRTAFVDTPDARQNPPPGDAAAQPRFVAEIEPVLRTDIYGYRPAPHVFLKIFTFDPRTVGRIANIVAQRGLPPELVPPDTPTYESHIPFHMQFLIDHNLSGMAYINLETCRFRSPLPDARTSDPAAMLSKPIMERTFVAGIENLRHDLMWPFAVAKRARSELELDSFPQHILNAKGRNEEGPYAFVSRTLRVLWEEERLRTGMYPQRERKVPRDVVAGSHLSDEAVRKRLREVVEAERQGAQEMTAPGSMDHVAAFLESQSQMTREQSLPAGYDDVFKVLDATASIPTVEDDFEIQQFDDDVQGEGALDFGDAGQSRGDEQAANGKEEGGGIQNDWIDIADCTQHGSDDVDDEMFSGLALQPQKRARLEDDVAEEDVHISSPPLSDPDSIGTASQRDLGTQQSVDAPTPEVEDGLEVRLAGVKSGAKTTSQRDDKRSSQRNATGITNPTSLPGKTHRQETKNILPETELGGTVSGGCQCTGEKTIFIHPRERPPCVADVLKSSRAGGSFSIVYTTPFYGKKEDEVKSGQHFGGLNIPVRASGAEGYPPFPNIFETSKSTVEILPRIVRPAERPPTVSEVKRAMSEARESTRKNPRKVVQDIDSAGRQIRRQAEGTVRDPLNLSEDPAIDFVPYRLRDRNLRDDRDDASDSSDDPEFKTPRLDRIQTADEIDSDDDNFVQNRPLSPKYDEGFQLFVNTSRHNAETPRRKGSESALRKRTILLSEGENRNSTVSLSESMHRYQNLTITSVEVLAACYSDRLPDPNQNQILAVCAVTQKDRKDVEGQKVQRLTFVVDKNTKSLSNRHLVIYCDSETQLLDALASHILNEDPDVLIGFETQNSSIGYILERSAAINHSFQQSSSRWAKGTNFNSENRQRQGNNSAAAAYYHRKGADIKITGRHVLSLWRIVRKEVKLSAYSREAVASELFQTTFPKHTSRDLEKWLTSTRHSGRAICHLERLASLNLAISNKLNILNRTGELARVFGIDFMSVLTRGSQFRVESMLGRVSRTSDYLLLAAPREGVFQQPAVEALPLVMEPQSALYVDPVIVLDFQSLYPSVIIGHNLCYSTMLGNVNRVMTWSECRRIGVIPKYVPPALDSETSIPMENIYVSSSGEMFVDSSIRRGILPQLLEELLETRVMVKKSLKGIVNDDVTAGLLNARQFGLKMIANVTYGYTAASFSGRMPCSGLADAIVQCGRDSLEEIVRYVEEELKEETGATVVYGDTDSLFVKVPGATRNEAFDVGERIVKKASEMFPDPITLKLEKVYQPCILQTKKRYVGYSYESRDQALPIFDAKGIETVRRDSCPLVQKALEKAIRLLFETKDVSIVKQYIQRLCQKLHLDRVPFCDYIFRKEVRLGSYKEGHLPPAAIVATKAMEHDPRSVPRHGERVPFVVLYDRPGAPLRDCVVSPEDYLDSARRGMARLNTTYYITKQILPTLNRVFSLIGVRVSAWYAEIPRPQFEPILSPTDPDRKRARSKQSSLRMFYTTERCILCHGKGVNQQVCRNCLQNTSDMQASRYLLSMRGREQERNRSYLLRKCFACVDGPVDGARDVSCGNVTCVVFDGLSVVDRKIEGLRHVLDDPNIWTL